MTQARHFLEIGGDDDDAEPGFERLIEQPVDLRLGADIDARGGSSAMSAFPPIASQRPTTTFC